MPGLSSWLAHKSEDLHIMNLERMGLRVQGGLGALQKQPISYRKSGTSGKRKDLGSRGFWGGRSWPKQVCIACTWLSFSRWHQLRGSFLCTRGEPPGLTRTARHSVPASVRLILGAAADCPPQGVPDCHFDAKAQPSQHAQPLLLVHRRCVR